MGDEKKTEKARIEWGGSHSILATGARRNPELRGGSHSILSKRQLRDNSEIVRFLLPLVVVAGGEEGGQGWQMIL